MLTGRQTYGGRSLFEQFDTEVQDQIHIFLEQAAGVLGLAYQLLNRRQENSPVDKEIQLLAITPTKSGKLSPAPSETSLSSMKRPGSFQRLRWSLLDKKRVEVIVRDFSELNGRVHESIKLWCLGTSIGIDLQHLKRLEDDYNSRVLGFDVDARLQMATSQTQVVPKILEVNELDLQQKICDVKQFGDNFGVFSREGKPMLVEYRSYSP